MFLTDLNGFTALRQGKIDALIDDELHPGQAELHRAIAQALVDLLADSTLANL